MTEFLSRKLAEYESDKQRAAQEKQRQWLEIQDKAPDLAEFMRLLSAKFGKVRLVSLEFTGDKNGE